MVKAIVNPIHALMFNLRQTMTEIGAIYYFAEFGNDKHTVLWTFISQMLIRDLISHQHQRRLMGREAMALVKRLASMTASHWRTTYSK
eukprot:scaffold52284_cov47-Attheya_sp.AAC.1